MKNLPTLTYVLDGIGLFGALVGGFVATKSTYVRQNSKDAAILINTQGKRIDELERMVKDLNSERQQLHKDIQHLTGELKAYSRVSYIEPSIVTKLSETLDAILGILSKEGLNIKTQHVKTQIVEENK